ncbi:zinc-ribbon domain-containing protein [Bifidobacterium sp. ESL0764]|uniref:zinc ribbon domain-containing protein n=1 Tax=Bifidobacterium sp. ESL0764 TaxID=2983228 RepID=UPI0023F82B98|nr:zinc-ribbon domain-containing protein [Bifidobacterium sp. ESL0764]WEV65675.1 zinc-ribbon domain-containing protein [Bifidobacterium sp. ESL0764]
MYCPHCGTTLPENSRFCSHCGQSTQPASAATPAAPMAPAAQSPSIPLPGAATSPAGPAAPAAAPQMPAQAAPNAAGMPQYASAPAPAVTPVAQAAPTATQQKLQGAYQSLSTPENVKTMGVSLGIGVGAAAVLALINTIILEMASSSSAVGDIGSLPFGDFSEMLKVKSSDFLHVLVMMMVAGVSGTFSGNASASSDATNGTMSAVFSIWLPMSLSGIALILGAAFGAYFIAHQVGARFKWNGVISSVVVGLAAGLVYVLLAAIFPFTTAASIGDAKAGATLGGASFRTFFMAFLMAGIGALIGYAMAQYASDSNDVFHAIWRFSHRMRGPARTFVEAFALYALLSTIVALITLIIMVVGVKTAAPLLMIPIAMPYLQFLLTDIMSFGGLTASDPQSSSTVTFADLMSAKQWAPGTSKAWIFILLAIVFFIVTFYIALRAAVRTTQDPFYAKWNHTWKAPVATAIFWFIAVFGLTAFGAQHATDSMSITIATWYPLLAAVWAFAIEAVAITFGPTVLASVPELWKIAKGGAVEPTPQNIKDYVTACGANFKRLSELGNGGANKPAGPAAPAAPSTPSAPTAPLAPQSGAPAMPATPTMPAGTTGMPTTWQNPVTPQQGFAGTGVQPSVPGAPTTGSPQTYTSPTAGPTQPPVMR